MTLLLMGLIELVINCRLAILIPPERHTVHVLLVSIQACDSKECIIWSLNSYQMGGAHALIGSTGLPVYYFIGHILIK